MQHFSKDGSNCNVLPAQPTVHIFTNRDHKTLKYTDSWTDWRIAYGTIMSWPLKKKHTSTLEKQRLRRKNCWVWEDAADHEAVLECQFSSMWLKSPSLLVSPDASRAYVWSNKGKIDGRLRKCRHLYRDLHAAKWWVAGSSRNEDLNIELLHRVWWNYHKIESKWNPDRVRSGKQGVRVCWTSKLRGKKNNVRQIRNK